MMNFFEKQWKKNWSGPWTLLECFYYGKFYVSSIQQSLGVGLRCAVFVSRKGRSENYLSELDVDGFGTELARRVSADHTLMVTWCEEIRKRSEDVLSHINQLNGKHITPTEYNRVWAILERYAIAIFPLKVVGDYLPFALSETLMPMMSAVRVMSEPVYAESALFMKRFAQQVSLDTGLPPEYVLASSDSEIQDYFNGKRLVASDVLKQRFEASILYVDCDGTIECSSEKVDQHETDLIGSHDVGAVRGVTAFPGMARGKVRVIMNPTAIDHLEADAVLVTGMTRPEYLHLFRESVAVVTDAGGVLSHAAITARELKKPCIIGTKIATQVLKDGMYVEVNADEGIVKILEM